MPVTKMEMVTVIGSLEKLNTFLSKCCLDKEYHPEHADGYISDSLGFRPLSESNIYEERLQEITDLARNFEVELTLLELKNIKKKDDVLDDQYLHDLSSQLKELQDKRNALLEKIKHNKLLIEQFHHFDKVDLPLNEIFSCEFIKVRFGHLPMLSLKKLDLYEDNPYLIFFPSSYDATDAWGVYFAPSSQVEEIDRIFTSLYFERMRVPDTDKTPQESMELLEKENAQTQKEVERLNQQIKEFWEKELEHCNILYTLLHFRSALSTLRSYSAVYRGYFCAIGWIPQEEYEHFASVVEGIEDIAIETNDANDVKDHDPPTKLKNPKIIKPYETFVKMYGVPNYKEIDPTPFLALLFPILFGIMFADLGQGIVVAIIGFFLLKIRKMDFGKIMMWCGASSAVFGTVLGSVFGDEEMLNPLFHLFGLDGKPLDVMERITTVLVIAIFIGVFLVYVAMALHIFSSLKNRKFGEALFSENGLTGVVCYTGGVIFVTQFMNKGIHLLPTGGALALMLVPLAILYFKEILIGLIDGGEWKPESWADYLISNLFELLEYALSYFSNTLSFLRVGAFVLVHAVMMQVVYSMAPANPVGRIIVLVLGNIFVMGIECLLTSIQVIRLGFYEMFSRFYVGDGYEFKAISMKNTSND